MLIRPATIADAAGLARVHIDTWKTTYRGIIPDSYLDALSYERGAKGWEKLLVPGTTNRTFVAVNSEGTVVGFANGGPNRDAADAAYRGELYAIYILQGYQNQGIGKDLLRHLAQALLAEGLDSMITWAIAGNAPARRFYEAKQGKPAGQKGFEIAGKALQEVAYGWSDIRVLLD